MKINSFQNFNYNCAPAFCARPKVEFGKDKKQMLDCNVHFILMNHYGKQVQWAQRMNEIVYQVSPMIERNEDFDNILSTIEQGVRKANHSAYWGQKDNSISGYPLIPGKRGGDEYFDKYAKKVSQAPGETLRPKGSGDCAKANTVSISPSFDKPNQLDIVYGFNPKNETSNLNLVKKEYLKLKQLKNPSLDEINKSCATIRWLIAQESPYKKGNDSIGNLLIKSIYRAYNVYISPLKNGRSLDFEAFYRDLDEFVKIYPKLFKTKPFFIK